MRKHILYLVSALLFSVSTHAQIPTGVYMGQDSGTTYRLAATADYMILSQYQSNPANFIKTWGGFYTADHNSFSVKLEFNSNYKEDSLKQMEVPFEVSGDELILTLAPNKDITLNIQPKDKQDLDGQWLFGTRGPDTGQDRRGDSSPRKTLKFLLDGSFQWIAYNTDTMAFMGTGGGTYTAVNGKYTEHITFFSRDNSRVGAELGFDYTIKGNDWHHQGLNSKGEPMYEIWMRR